MQQLLFEDEVRFDLQPLTFTRPVYDLRVGIDTIREKWTRFLGQAPKTSAWDYLGKYYNNFDPSEEALLFNGRFLPSAAWISQLKEALEPGSYLVNEQNEVLAAWFRPEHFSHFKGLLSLEAELVVPNPLEEMRAISFDSGAQKALRDLTDIFQLNGASIREDVAWMFSNRKSEKVADQHSAIYGKDNIFAEEGVKIRAAVLNAEDGPIYLGRGVDVQEGAMVHSTHAFLDHATLNMGAKLRGDTTVGPWSKVGGEIANSVIMGYSNKGHDGYLGNSVMGYWCNVGADSNTSNLKNNYSEVRLWNYRTGRFKPTGTIFCGLIMGDHSKCGINTMFNTGTVVGVSANIFGAGFPRNFIPSFSWGGAQGMTTYQLRKVLEVARIVMARRKIELSSQDEEIFTKVMELTKTHRRWEDQK